MKARNAVFQLAIPLLVVYLQPGRILIQPNRQAISVSTTAVDSIEFIFQRENTGDTKEVVSINGAIVNNSNITRYFLSYSCDGMQDFIIADTSFLQKVRMINCNASYPVKVKLNPFTRITFRAHFKVRKKEAPFQLSYQLVLLNDNFDPDDMHYARPERFSLLPFIVLKGKEE